MCVLSSVFGDRLCTFVVFRNVNNSEIFVPLSSELTTIHSSLDMIN